MKQNKSVAVIKFTPNKYANHNRTMSNETMKFQSMKQSNNFKSNTSVYESNIPNIEDC